MLVINHHDSIRWNKDVFWMRLIKWSQSYRKSRWYLAILKNSDSSLLCENMSRVARLWSACAPCDFQVQIFKERYRQHFETLARDEAKLSTIFSLPAFDPAVHIRHTHTHIAHNSQICQFLLQSFPIRFKCFRAYHLVFCACEWECLVWSQSCVEFWSQFHPSKSDMTKR